MTHGKDDGRLYIFSRYMQPTDMRLPRFGAPKQLRAAAGRSHPSVFEIFRKEQSFMSFDNALPKLRRFLLSRRFFAILILLGTFVFVSGALMQGIPPSEIYDAPRVAPTQVAGVAAFVLLISFILVVSDDITAVFCPFLILCVFACDCYNSFSVFSRMWWLGIPAVAALVFHFVHYRMPLVVGRTFPGIVAVGASILLGGVGTITLREYFAPTALYYTMALSVGMAAVYLLVRPQLERPAEFDRAEKHAEIMYAMGVFVCLEAVFNILIRIEPIIRTGCIPEIQQHNNFATFLLFALPFPFYFARRNRRHLFVAALMLVCLFASDSRGAVITTAVVLPFLIAYLVVTSRKKWGKRLTVITVAVFAVIGICGVCAMICFFKRIGAGFISPNEPRYRLLVRAFEAFRKNPVFGTGLGDTGNVDIYNPKAGAFYWYHSLPLQIIGSLGIVGVAAYVYQALARMVAVTRRLDPATAALGISYLGVLIMSCFNPGEFVPFPYEMMVVVTFALVEHVSSDKRSEYITDNRKN